MESWEGRSVLPAGLWACPQRLEGCQGLVGSQGHRVSGILVGPLSDRRTLRNHFEHGPSDHMIAFIINDN